MAVHLTQNTFRALQDSLKKFQTMLSKVLMTSHCPGKPNSASLTESWLVQRDLQTTFAVQIVNITLWIIIKLEIIASTNFGDAFFIPPKILLAKENARCLCPHVDLHTKTVQKTFEKKRPETIYVGCSRLQQKRRRFFVTTKTKVKKQRLQETFRGE